MGKWRIVYKNNHGYIEISPVFYLKPIRKKSIQKQKQKRKRYSIFDKIKFLKAAENSDDFKKAAEKAGIPYLTAQKWKMIKDNDPFYFLRKLYGNVKSSC